ncbi:hypothetical protein [Streptomyces sp. NPDC048606]|uniref:hypothetical protein n=1 Tax=Streptomyces sp. NPDC048606 TaxID=3154726 RepID=UPI00343BCD32
MSWPTEEPLDPASVLAEIKVVRREGVTRLSHLDVPLLRRVAAGVAEPAPVAWPMAVERMLRTAVELLGEGELRQAAEYSLGLTTAMRGRAAADRRRLAAGVYGVSTERFRKFQEGLVLNQVAEQVCWIAANGAAARPGTPAERAAPLPAPDLQHQRVELRGAGRYARVVLHVHPVELLRGVDVVVAPTNTHLHLPGPYKASVAAALRRAAEVRDASGAVLQDPLQEGLTAWRGRHGLTHGTVAAGTVVPTTAGALAGQGVRRVYHAAVAIPRTGSNDYDVLPRDIAAAASGALALMAREAPLFDPPLRSVCFALLGAGRGGLPVQESVSALWPALAAAVGAGREVHLVMRRPAVAGTLLRVLDGRRVEGAGDPAAYRCDELVEGTW